MLDPERDCLPLSEMTVPSMLRILVRSGSPKGVVGIGYQLIKMIGKLTHTKEFALDSKLDWPYMVFSMFFPSNKLDERRATIQAAVANAKNQRFLSRGVEAAELMMEGISIDQKESLHAMLSQVETVDHSQARKKAKNHQPTMFEFCCSKESTLGYVNADRGINHFRLSKDITDLTDPQDVDTM